jgi:hypothetical protein
MICNVVTNTRPYFVHACGKLEFCPTYPSILDYCKPTPSRPDPRITIITFRNRAGIGHCGKDLETFERNLRDWGIPCIVLGLGLEDWKNRLKLSLLSEFLPQVKTRYILVADSSDVAMVRPLDGLVEEFESLGVGAVFNGERNLWPPDLAEDLRHFEERIAGIREFPRLNAGLWMATTDFARAILYKWQEVPLFTAMEGSEQIYYKTIYPLFYPSLIVDHGCRLFQNLNRVPWEMFTCTCI